MCTDLARCRFQRGSIQADGVASLLSELTRSLAPYGGLIPEDSLRSYGVPVELVTGWMDQGRVRSISHGQKRWLPLFQLAERGRVLRVDVAAVADELQGAMDDFEILAWFARPNASLGDETPIECLERSVGAVTEVARLDRFLVSH